MTYGIPNSYFCVLARVGRHRAPLSSPYNKITQNCIPTSGMSVTHVKHPRGQIDFTRYTDLLPLLMALPCFMTTCECSKYRVFQKQLWPLHTQAVSLRKTLIAVVPCGSINFLQSITSNCYCHLIDINKCVATLFGASPLSRPWSQFACIQLDATSCNLPNIAPLLQSVICCDMFWSSQCVTRLAHKRAVPLTVATR
jgi:hypothetical protein